MSWFASKWLILPAVVGVAGTVMAFQPQSETAIDHATEALIRADPNHQQLTARGAVILDRIQYKDELIDQLIAGRLTL